MRLSSSPLVSCVTGVSVISNRFKQRISCDSASCHLLCTLTPCPDLDVHSRLQDPSSRSDRHPLGAGLLTVPQLLGSSASACSTLNLGIRRYESHLSTLCRSHTLRKPSYVIWRDMNKMVVWVLSFACVGHAALVAIREFPSARSSSRHELSRSRGRTKRLLAMGHSHGVLHRRALQQYYHVHLLPIQSVPFFPSV